MKVLLTAIAMIALLGFVGSVHAAKEAKPKPGHFVKVEGMEVTYIGGAKGKGAEHKVKIDDKTKVTIDGKDAKISDIKPDTLIEVTEEKGVATVIAATTTPPAKK